LLKFEVFTLQFDHASTEGGRDEREGLIDVGQKGLDELGSVENGALLQVVWRTDPEEGFC
jgi:hypothetical protein